MQVYDMSVLRAAQWHPRRRLPTDVPRPAPEQPRSAGEENSQARYSLPAMLQGPGANGAAMTFPIISPGQPLASGQCMG